MRMVIVAPLGRFVPAGGLVLSARPFLTPDPVTVTTRERHPRFASLVLAAARVRPLTWATMHFRGTSRAADMLVTLPPGPVAVT